MERPELSGLINMSGKKKSKEGNPIGRRVKFTKIFLKFQRENAWDSNIVSERIISEKSAESYLRMKLLGSGYPYRAVLTGYGCDRDTYRVEVILGGRAKLPEFRDFFYVDRKEVRIQK